MSRFAKKVGQKSMRFQFDVTVNFVEIHIPIEAKVFVIWKRGAKRIETRGKVDITPDHPRGELNETMSMLATLSKDTAKDRYIEKNTTFTVKVLTETKMKSIGMIKMNLAKFAEKPDHEEEFVLRKCPDRNAIISLTIKNTLIQADCKDADTLSQMTDLRSLDSAPDSHFDFEDLKKDREEESALERNIDPMKLLERDYDKQRKGLPPAFGAAQMKNLKSDQFSLRGKAATSTMASLHGGPIKINNKLEAKEDISETPEKMDDCSITSEENTLVSKSPRSRKMKGMPQMADLSEDSTQNDKKPRKISRGSIRKIKRKKDKEDGKETLPSSAFSYNQPEQYEEVKRDLSSKFQKEDYGGNGSQNIQIIEEVKELRSKIRKLEYEKEALKEESIKVKQKCADDIKAAMEATGSDDKKAEYLQLELSEIQTTKDKLELKLSKKDNEINKMNRKLEDKDIDIKHMKDKRNELQDKIIESENKTKQLSIEMKNFREQIGHYEQENVSLRNEISTLNTTYNRLKEENQESNSMIEKLRSQLENKRSSFKDSPTVDNSEFEEYKIATEALIADSKDQIRELEKKNEDLAKDYDRLLQEKEDADTEYFKKSQKANKDISLLQQTESSLKATITDLEKRVDDLFQERLDKERSGLDSHSELEGKYRALELQLSQNATKIRDKDDKIRTLENKLTLIEEDKQYMMSQEEQKRDEMRDDFRFELEELKDKVTQLENKNDQLLIEKDILQQKLDKEVDSNFNNDDIMEGNERLLSQIKKLQNQINEKDNMILDLQSEPRSQGASEPKTFTSSRRKNDSNRELAEMSVENEFLKNQVEELNERLKDLQGFGRTSDSSASDGFYNNIKGDGNPDDVMKKLKQENSTLSTELIEIKIKHAESDQERSAIQLKLKERNEILKKLSSEITKYEFEMVKAKQSLGEVLNQNIELDEYNSELISTIEKLKTKKKKK
ncbi:unnamed protein product [Moneuplotes crassus]|uniref:C2 NT-type domain-containing protein n=1 Tax=Euplotes crassus TaxID=5936 RepID=A0AAD1Y024_EUPCR|nr:unnamed protein product [Moneuplotes crassus]